MKGIDLCIIAFWLVLVVIMVDISTEKVIDKIDETVDLKASITKKDSVIIHLQKYVNIAYRMDSTLKANNIKETFILTD